MLVGPRVVRRRALVAGAAVGVAAANRANANNQPEPAAPQEPAPQAAPEPVDETAELQKYADLHAQGVLTDEEFEAKKKQILGI